MKDLWEVGEFVRKIRARMRFGELSRAPLRLLRLELRGDTAQCDWLARLGYVGRGVAPARSGTEFFVPSAAGCRGFAGNAVRVIARG